MDTSDIRKNLKIMLDGQPYAVADFQFVKPGKGQAFTRVKLKNLHNGAVLEKTFKSGEKLEPADIEQRTVQYIYPDGQNFVFMDPNTGEQRVALEWDDLGRRLCMAWPTAPVGSDDDWTLDVISTLLAGGRTSRMTRRLVLEDALATSISTHNDTRVEAGVFWLLAECAQGVEADVLERAVDVELERLANEPVPAAELRRAHSILIASESYENETVTDLAETVGEFAIDGDWRMALDGNEHIRAVTAKRVRETAARLLASDRRVVGWSLPSTAPLPPVIHRARARKRARKA